MPQPIKVHFALAGAKELNSAFQGIIARVRQLNAVEQQVGLARERASKRTALTMKAANENASKAIARAAEQQARAVQKAAAAEVASVRKAEQAKVREAEKAARQTERVRQQSARVEQRLREQQVLEAKRVAERVNAIAKQRAAQSGTIVGRAVGNTLGTIGNVAGGLGATIGTYAIGQSLFANATLHERATQLVNATRDGKGTPTQSVAGLVGEAQGVAQKFGMDSSDVMGSMELVAARAGGAEGLRKYRDDLDDLAQTAKAYGIAMQDMGGVVAAALNSGVAPGTEMRRLIQDLVAQGKDGAVEFKDLASELARLAGAGLAFGSGADMIRRSAGLAQIAVRQRVSPEEARTSVIDLVRDINTHSVELKKSGITAHKNDGKQRDPMDVVADIVDAAFGGKGVWAGSGKGFLKGTPGLAHVFTGTSLAIGSAMSEEYIKAGGGKQGKEAIRQSIQKASGATLAPGERDSAFQLAMATPNTAMAQTRAAFEREIGRLLPEITKLVPQVAQLTAKFAQLAVWVGQNPFQGLSVAFTGHFAKALIDAKLGDVARTAVGSAFANLGAIAITAHTIYLAGKSIIDDASEKGSSAGGAVRTIETNIPSARAALQRGDISPEQARKLAEESQGKLDTVRKAMATDKPWIMESGFVQDALKSVVPMLGPLTGAANAGNLALSAYKQQGFRGEAAGGSLDSAQRALDEFTLSVRKASEAAKDTTITNPGAPSRQGRPVGMGP